MKGMKKIQGIGRRADRTEPFGEGGGEELGRHHGEDIEDEGEKQHDRPHARQGGYQPAHHAAQRRHHGDEAQDAQDAQRTQDRQIARRREERDRDDQEVEDAPRVPEEVGSVDEEAGQEFENEDRKNDAVEGDQHRTESSHCLGRRLEPQRDGIDDDQHGDRHFDTARFDERLECGHDLVPEAVQWPHKWDGAPVQSSTKQGGDSCPHPSRPSPSAAPSPPRAAP